MCAPCTHTHTHTCARLPRYTAGRRPNLPLSAAATWGARGWKTEETINYAYPASLNVLNGVITREQWDTWVPLAQAVRMVWSKDMRNGGWTKDDAEVLHRLLMQHVCRLELTVRAEGNLVQVNAHARLMNSFAVSFS